jgi:response regulator RpfG family c-di-GMP phosphodiesterase
MKYNIIYVDDEPENLRAFESVFRRDFNIYITDSPLQGLDYLHNNDVDLIITDQRMDEMTGLEFLKKVYEFMPEKPPCRMILSAYSRPQLIDEAIKKNWVSTFISKPWDPEELKMKIDTTISEC